MDYFRTGIIKAASGFMSIIARMLLFLMGWSKLDALAYMRLIEHDHNVLIFSHTSYFDFYILILYMLAYPYRHHYVRTLIKPQAFEKYGKILHILGGIPSTRLEDKQGGAVNRIVENLNKYEKFLFLISPKGKIEPGEWRSGYINIAKKTRSHMRTIGLDYVEKKVVVSKSIHYNAHDVEGFLKEELKEIVPLYPECEVVQIKAHDATRRNVVDRIHLYLCFTFMLWFLLTVKFFGFYNTVKGIAIVELVWMTAVAIGSI